jgi:hypothetical protein
LDSLGFGKLARDFYNDVLSGDIPLDKVGKMTVENYVRKTAKTRVEEERLAKAAAKAFKINAENTLRQRAAAIPNDKTFGNAGIIELTKDTPEYDIIRTMSEDTAVLDHCVGQGGSARGSEDRNPWYGNSQRSYEPILDLVTGQPNPRASSDRTSYVNYVQNGDKIISVRDLTTGLPQATLHLEQSRIGNSGQQKYSIGYASGHQNGDIDAKYSGAIRDYLNSIADEIDSSGHNLQSHAGGFGAARTSRFSPRFASRGCPAWVWGSGHHQPLPTSTAAAINVNGGTLLWNNDHQVSNNVAVTLNGGRLDLNGCTESLGVLTLTVSSVIDLGPGGDLAFAGRGYGIPEPFCRFGTMTVRLTQARVRKRISSSLA